MAGRHNHAAFVLQRARPGGNIAAAQEGQRTFSSGLRFVEMSGEELYKQCLPRCHMMDGKGASGAAAIRRWCQSNWRRPVIRLRWLVGGRAHAAVGDMMNEAQVAAVVNYLRTHFGNAMADVVTARMRATHGTEREGGDDELRSMVSLAR